MEKEIEYGLITFDRLADVQVFSELVNDRLDVLKQAGKLMHDLGYAQNTVVQHEARLEALNMLRFQVAAIDNIRRLHPAQCPDKPNGGCPLGDIQEQTNRWCDKKVETVVASIRRIESIEASMLLKGYVDGPEITEAQVLGLKNYLN